MSAADGTVLGLTKIFDAGPPSARFNIVIVSDGYQAAQMAQFQTDANAIRDALFLEPPFEQAELTCAINIYRLDVTSTDTGADKPNCSDGGGGNTFVDTYFDSSFCADGATQRLVYGDAQLAMDTVEALLPQWHQIMVLVNDAERGGGGGSVAFFSTGGMDWRQVAVHEMGHSAFGLADEYDYGGPDDWPGGEPGEPNVTAQSDPALVKWSALVTAGSLSPTRDNPSCTSTDPGPSGVPAGTVGTFEGAKYSHCGAYRPVWNCMMRDTGADFCPVCTDRIMTVMAPFAQPAPGGNVALANTTVDFNDVPTGLTVVRAARFNVDSCFGITVQALNAPAAPFALESPIVTVMQPAGPAPWPGYFWFRLTAGAVGPIAPQQVTLRCLETNEDFVVTLTGNVITRPTVATQLVFDKSGSMLGLTDEGITKEQVLRNAASVFTDLVWDDNGIGINAYDQDPHPVMDIETAGAPGAGLGRDHALGAIAGHASNPSGMTAIGDGIELARTKLDTAPGSWDSRAMLVLTDGIETEHKYISEVADGVIGQKVFAIGMGTAEQIQPAALDALTSGTGGYLLMTGNLSSDETFLLEKYYLQILAGLNNNELVLDPEGWVRVGVVERIPFDVTDADVEITATVLGRPAQVLIMGLEAPDGTQIAAGDPALIGRSTSRALYMRAGLPLFAGGRTHQTGRWHLLLAIHPEFWKRLGGGANDPAIGGQFNGPGIRYSASVAAYSSLRLAAAVHQNSLQPGATMTVRGTLTEYGSPFLGNGKIVSETVRPDGYEWIMPLVPVAEEPGAWSASLSADQTGVYRFRLIASGRNRHDQKFTREAIRTGAVWRGGDNPVDHPGASGQPGNGGGRGSGLDWCALLKCLFGKGAISDELVNRLLERGLDIRRLRECIAENCQHDEDQKVNRAMLFKLRQLVEQLEVK